MSKPEIVQESGVTVVNPGPESSSIYESSLSEFDEVLELANSVDPPRMVMDLTHTNFCGSAFLGLLVRLSNRVSSKEGGRFAVCGLSKYVNTLVTTSKLHLVFEVFPNRDEAIAQMS